MSEIDNEVGAALRRFNDSQTRKAKDLEQATREEDEWVAAFEKKRKEVIRPTMEALGEKLRAAEHDFNLVETEFRRDNRAVPDESSIRMDIYLSTDRTRTGIGMDRRPCLLFKTHHRSKLVHLIVSDMTDRGGEVSKEGEYPLDKVDATLIKEKFILLFQRLMRRA
jgi:hypothetical protein